MRVAKERNMVVTYGHTRRENIYRYKINKGAKVNPNGRRPRRGEQEKT